MRTLSSDSWACLEQRYLKEWIASIASSALFCCFISKAMSLSALSTLSLALIAFQNSSIAASASFSTSWPNKSIKLNIFLKKKKNLQWNMFLFIYYLNMFCSDVRTVTVRQLMDNVVRCRRVVLSFSSSSQTHHPFFSVSKFLNEETSFFSLYLSLTLKR